MLYHVLLFYLLKFFLYFSPKNKMMLQATFLGGLPMSQELPGLLWQMGHGKVSPHVGHPGGRLRELHQEGTHQGHRCSSVTAGYGQEPTEGLRI